MMADIKFINDATLASLHEDRMMRMLVCDALMYSRAWNDTRLTFYTILEQLSNEIESELIIDLIKDFAY